jgi:hypothetical protein
MAEEWFELPADGRYVTADGCDLGLCGVTDDEPNIIAATITGWVGTSNVGAKLIVLFRVEDFVDLLAGGEALLERNGLARQ